MARFQVIVTIFSLISPQTPIKTANAELWKEFLYLYNKDIISEKIKWKFKDYSAIVSVPLN